MTTANTRTLTEKKAKVLAVLAKKPGSTVRDIAKDTGIPITTSHRYVKELEQSGTYKDPTIVAMAMKSLELSQKVTELEAKFVDQLLEEKGKLIATDANIASQMGDRGAKRYQVFMGDVTDDKGALNIILDE